MPLLHPTVEESPPIRRDMLLLRRVLAVEVREGRMKDETAAFVLRSPIGSVKEARSTTPRPDTPSGYGERASVEIMALKSNIFNHTAHAYNDGNTQKFVDMDRSFDLVLERTWSVRSSFTFKGQVRCWC